MQGRENWRIGVWVTSMPLWPAKGEPRGEVYPLEPAGVSCRKMCPLSLRQLPQKGQDGTEW